MFLTVSAGHGHTKAAEVMIDNLKLRSIECVLLDILDYINPIIAESIIKGYSYSARYTPHIYGRIYDIVDEREKAEGKLSLPYIINKALSKKLFTFFKEYKPELVICTHNFPAMIISYLKGKNIIDAKTYGIVTDFTIHPLWEETTLDYYVTADELLDKQALKKEIGHDKILPYGIPIDPIFGVKNSCNEIRKKLGLDDQYTVLIMGGSMGYGDIESVIDEIDNLSLDFQIVSICGKNKSLKKKIDGKKYKKKLYNYGFVDNIHEFMDAANCILTKPGGLTASECLAKQLPMILINPIPGQEERNAEFLINNGVAILTTETYTPDEAIYQLMTSFWRKEFLIRGSKILGKPNSTGHICDFIYRNDVLNSN